MSENPGKDPNFNATQTIEEMADGHDETHALTEMAGLQVADDQDLHDDALNQLAQQLYEWLENEDYISLGEGLSSLHVADAADLLERLEPERVEAIAHHAYELLPSSLWAELREDYAAPALNVLPLQSLVKALDELDSDDAVAVAAQLDKTRLAQIYAQLDENEQRLIENFLEFDEDSAGRLMQKEFVAAPIFWTAGQALDHMRSVSADLPDQFFDIYVIDPTFKLRGMLPLHLLIRTARETPLRNVMQSVLVEIKPETDQEDAAYLFEKYDLVSAPVTDEYGRLVGMLTVDDMVRVLRSESDEDALALAGVKAEERAESVLSRLRSRLPWLIVNLGTAIIASFVIGLFGATIEQMIALAILMPIVAALGGNAGMQALTVTVRSLASRDLTGANALRLIRIELLSAFLNGAIFAVLLGLVAGIWFGDIELSWVIGIAIWGNFLCAGMAGILFPLLLKKLGADPAVASSVFVSTATDLFGFFAFLGLATIFLM